MKKENVKLINMEIINYLTLLYNIPKINMKNENFDILLKLEFDFNENFFNEFKLILKFIIKPVNKYTFHYNNISSKIYPSFIFFIELNQNNIMFLYDETINLIDIIKQFLNNIFFIKYKINNIVFNYKKYDFPFSFDNIEINKNHKNKDINIKNIEKNILFSHTEIINCTYSKNENIFLLPFIYNKNNIINKIMTNL